MQHLSIRPSGVVDIHQSTLKTTAMADRAEPFGIERFIGRLTARSLLNLQERTAIASLSQQRLILPGRKDFVRQNEQVSHCSLIVSGLVGRFEQLPNGARQITALYIPGDMVDLDAAVRPVPIGGLHALVESTIIRVPLSEIRALSARYPALVNAFWRDSMLDTAVLTRWAVNVGKRSATARLAHFFCEMSLRYGDGVALTEFPFPMTQEQVGEACALTGVHVNRTLKALRKRDLVSHRNGTLRILDWSKLAKVGEFNGAYMFADALAERPRPLSTAA